MPRKTKKQKLLAQNRPKQLPKHEQTVVIQTNNLQVERTPLKQLPLINHVVQPKKVEPISSEASHYFRQDIQKTALITGVIIVIELLLYKFMQNGMLEKWLPSLKL